MTTLKQIPIFFATDDAYIPFLDVALSSLKENASKDYHYIINVLNTGLKQENTALVKRLADDNFTINFCDISKKVEPIKNKLKNVFHFSLVTYYRLFIEELFPEYDKALYLDCDIVVLGDISKLYNTDINEYLLAGIQEQVVNSHPVFREYSKVVLGLDPKYYINAGIILMNLKKFREYKIEDKFIHLINTYNFDTIAPDQDYLNLLCAGLIKYMPNGWNKESLPLDLEGNLNLVHYALYKKPWQHDNVLNGEHFWHYAEKSPFYNTILNKKQNFTAEDLARKEKANVQIVNDAITLTNSSFSFYSTLLKSERENLNSGKTTVQNVLKQFFINAGVLDGKKCG